ncbi:unnamed protein product [Amoebophrya sp. A120]|nr:unnamed protein product [Amoebophrya sp. A120]|eukprot:GSA120T00011254001.1
MTTVQIRFEPNYMADPTPSLGPAPQTDEEAVPEDPPSLRKVVAKNLELFLAFLIDPVYAPKKGREKVVLYRDWHNVKNLSVVSKSLHIVISKHMLLQRTELMIKHRENERDLRTEVGRFWKDQWSRMQEVAEKNRELRFAPMEAEKAAQAEAAAQAQATMVSEVKNNKFGGGLPPGSFDPSSFLPSPTEIPNQDVVFRSDERETEQLSRATAQSRTTAAPGEQQEQGITEDLEQVLAIHQKQIAELLARQQEIVQRQLLSENADALSTSPRTNAAFFDLYAGISMVEAGNRPSSKQSSQMMNLGRVSVGLTPRIEVMGANGEQTSIVFESKYGSNTTAAGNTTVHDQAKNPPPTTSDFENSLEDRLDTDRARDQTWQELLAISGYVEYQQEMQRERLARDETERYFEGVKHEVQEIENTLYNKSQHPQLANETLVKPIPVDEANATLKELGNYSSEAIGSSAKREIINLKSAFAQFFTAWSKAAEIAPIVNQEDDFRKHVLAMSAVPKDWSAKDWAKQAVHAMTERADGSDIE